MTLTVGIISSLYPPVATTFTREVFPAFWSPIKESSISCLKKRLQQKGYIEIQSCAKRYFGAINLSVVCPQLTNNKFGQYPSAWWLSSWYKVQPLGINAFGIWHRPHNIATDRPMDMKDPHLTENYVNYVFPRKMEKKLKSSKNKPQGS